MSTVGPAALVALVAGFDCAGSAADAREQCERDGGGENAQHAYQRASIAVPSSAAILQRLWADGAFRRRPPAAPTIPETGIFRDGAAA